MLRSLKSIRSLKAEGVCDAEQSSNANVSTEQQNEAATSEIDAEVQKFKEKHAKELNSVKQHLDESIRNVQMTQSLLSVK